MHDWPKLRQDAAQLGDALQELIEPVERVFVADASAPKQRRRLELVVLALDRVRARAEREIDAAAALAASRKERQRRFEEWRVRRDAMAEERKRAREFGRD